jgi:hypothetical protein
MTQYPNKSTIETSRDRLASEAMFLKVEAESALGSGFKSETDKEEALVSLVKRAAKLFAESREQHRAEALEWERTVKALDDDLAEAEELINERGGRIKSADLFELRRLADAGLIDRDVVEAEAMRRQSMGPNLVKRMGMDDAPIAGFGGSAICGFADCNRLIPPDRLHCEEHAKHEPRAFVNHHLSLVNLDELAFELEAKRAKALAEAKQAEADLEDVKKRIEAFDRTQTEEMAHG